MIKKSCCAEASLDPETLIVHHASATKSMVPQHFCCMKWRPREFVLLEKNVVVVTTPAVYPFHPFLITVMWPTLFIWKPGAAGVAAYRPYIWIHPPKRILRTVDAKGAGSCRAVRYKLQGSVQIACSIRAKISACTMGLLPSPTTYLAPFPICSTTLGKLPELT